MVSEKNQSAKVVLSRPLLQMLEAHVESCAPRECCGILIGTAESNTFIVDRCSEVENIAQDNQSFRMDPAGYRDIERECDRSGQQILGIFHSHPLGFARLSQWDLVTIQKLWGSESDWIYLIYGLKEQSSSRVRGWGWADHAVHELEVVV